MDDGIRRTTWRLGGRGRAAIGFAVIAALGLAACSGGGSDSSSKPTTTVAKGTHLEMKLGDVSAASAGPAVTVSAEQAQQVLDALTTYVKDATVEPLRSGKPAKADLAAVFDATTLTPATTTDRGVVFDEGLPKVIGDLDVVSSPVTIVGLGDLTGNLALVTAAFVVDAKGPTAIKGNPLHISRHADLVLAPDGAGGWKITSYDMLVTRDGGGLDATTTTTTAGAAK
jgi:hypothetical protein